MIPCVDFCLGQKSEKIHMGKESIRGGLYLYLRQRLLTSIIDFSRRDTLGQQVASLKGLGVLSTALMALTGGACPAWQNELIV